MLQKILFLSVLFFSNILFASTLSIDSQRFVFKEFEISKFVDPTNTLSLEDVQKKEFSVTVNNPYSNGFVSHQAIWHKFSLHNNLDHKIEFVLNDAQYHLPSMLDLYILNSKGELVESYFGGFDRDDAKQTDIGHILSFFRLYIEAQETYTFFIKSYYQKGNSSIYNYAIYDVDSHIEAMIFDNILLAFLLGGMLTLILYNLLIYFYTKDKVYLYYVAYLFFSFVIGFVYVSGFAHKFFSIEYNSWIHNATYATPLTVIFILLFTSQIFEMKKSYPKIHKLLASFIYFVVAYVILSLIFGLLDYLPLIMGLALVVGLTIVFIGIYMTYTKNKLGIIYLISTASYALFAVITIIYYLGFLPTNLFTSNALMIGSLLEGFGLSLLLAYRINLLEAQNTVLELLSSTDGLTGLYNRRHFNEVAPLEFNRSKRDQKIFAFAILDIDYFKNYNDNYGHQEGDKVLIQVAESLQKSFKRAEDLVFRIGGEEFGILLSAQSTKEIITLVESARKNIEALQIQHHFSLVSNIITASFGLGIIEVESTPSKLNIQKIYKEVDMLLYEAKTKGRNRVCFKTLNTTQTKQMEKE